MGTILIVILILLLVGAFPSWPHSNDWGYFPSGGLGIIPGHRDLASAERKAVEQLSSTSETTMLWEKAEAPIIVIVCVASIVMWCFDATLIPFLLLLCCAIYCCSIHLKDRRDGLPSAADLDAIAAEDTIRARTAGKRLYPATDACETTMTPRFAVECSCPTYPCNWGSCTTFEEGGNGRCVYCDHKSACHLRALASAARSYEYGFPLPSTESQSVNYL